MISITVIKPVGSSALRSIHRVACGSHSQPSSFLLLALLVATSGWGAGCSKAPDRPEVFPVQGTVTYKGKPVVDASIQFLAEGAPRPATGTTNDKGEFQLTTFEENDGAIPGTHQVLVMKTNQEDLEASAPVVDLESADYGQAMKKLQTSQRNNGGLPFRYRDLRRTDLKAEVKASEDNTIELTLKD